MVKEHLKIILPLSLIPLVLVAFAILFYYSQHGVLPDAGKWCIWDCGWYNGMREHGYIYKPNQQNNLAFFPLFPLVWKVLNVGNIGMGVINYLIFAAAAWLVVWQFKISIKTLVVFLTIGLCFFFMVPYTESFFFLGSVLLLLGFYKSNYWFITIGSIIAIGTRSASMIFLVSFVLMILLAILQKKKWADIKIVVFAMLAVLLVNTMVFAYQYQQTGRLLGCFEAHKYWDHYLRWPKLVHVSWHKPVALTENFALVVGLFCMLVLVTHFLNILMAKTKFKNPLAKVFVVSNTLSAVDLFALLYLSGGTSFILLYQQESLASLNRYILSTPFYLLLLHLLASRKVQLNVTKATWMGLIILFGFTVSHSHLEHKLLMILGAGLSTTTIFLVLPQNTKLNHAVSIVACTAALIIQAFLLHYYISGNWVG